MELDSNLLKDFARVTNDQGDLVKREDTVRGTVSVVGGKTFVKFDGSDILTPVEKSMDAADGDRVIVTITDHTATITGNTTCPASARTATSFMNLTQEGLVIGELDKNKQAVGSSSLIGPGAYYIVDSDGVKVASFSAKQIKLGAAEGAEILLCNGKGQVKSVGDVLLLYGEDAVGMRTTYNEYKAETVCKADSTNPVASIQAFKDYDGTQQAYVKVSLNNGIEMKAPKGKRITYNGSEVLASDSLLKAGVVTGTGSIKAGASIGFLKAVSLPDGYYLAGIRQISTNHHTQCVITAMVTNPSVGQVGCRVRNVGSKTINDLQINLEWFALKTKANDYDVTDTVSWTDDDDDLDA